MSEKILIVDDDPETLRLVSLMLKRQGFQIVAAESGQQAVAMASAEQPDIILLDVMMPDMDGYEVTRLLRKMPEVANTPIMMFTARTMVEDRVAGFEAGVDDYITKPVHPNELVAVIRTMLSRRRTKENTSATRGHTIGFLSAKGGIGLSTLVINLAVGVQSRTRGQVIAAEMRPGMGSWGLELGYANTSGLNNLLRARPAQLNVSAVDRELISTSYGVRLLLASNQMNEIPSVPAGQLDAIVQEIRMLGAYIFLDLGAMLFPDMEKVLEQCSEMIVPIDAFPPTVQRTRLLLDTLKSYGFGKTKPLTLVSYKRSRSELELSAQQLQEMTGQPIKMRFPSAPETVFNASQQCVPVIAFQPEGSLAIQFRTLADEIVQRVNK
ncbi:MAG TPA: response regulator [Anaerolineaceae bacterium]